MPNDDIVYLLKFAPQEAYIDDLMDGRLYMNAAGYYHGLPGEQGDPLEASLAFGMGCVSSRGLEQKEHRKLSSLSIGSAHAF